MADTVVEALILDLLEWVTKRDRTYEEVMEAWRTSCPRLSRRFSPSTVKVMRQAVGLSRASVSG